MQLDENELRLEAFEAFQISEAIKRRNAIAFALCLAISFMLFCCIIAVIYLSAVGTIAWYVGVIVCLVLAIIGWLNHFDTRENML